MFDPHWGHSQPDLSTFISSIFAVCSAGKRCSGIESLSRQLFGIFPVASIGVGGVVSNSVVKSGSEEVI